MHVFDNWLILYPNLLYIHLKKINKLDVIF